MVQKPREYNNSPKTSCGASHWTISILIHPHSASTDTQNGSIRTILGTISIKLVLLVHRHIWIVLYKIEIMSEYNVRKMSLIKTEVFG